MQLNGKIAGVDLDLHQLRDEIVAAGIEIGDLGTAGDELVTYDDEGHTITDLPAGVAALLATHKAPPPPPTQAEIQVAALQKAQARIADSPDLTPAIKAALGGALGDILAGLGIGGAG